MKLPSHQGGARRTTRARLVAGGTTHSGGAQTARARNCSGVHSGSTARNAAPPAAPGIATCICLLRSHSGGARRAVTTDADTSWPPSELVWGTNGWAVVVTYRRGSAITQRSLQTAGRPSITGPYAVPRDPEWADGPCPRIFPASRFSGTVGADAAGPPGGGPHGQPDVSHPRILDRSTREVTM